MANIRIVWDNAADRGDLACSSEAGLLLASNLRSNLKSRVWRGVTPSESMVCRWDDPEPVGCVVLAFNNFTARATMRVRGYTYATDMIPEYDSGDVVCAPSPRLGEQPWGFPLGQNFYTRGGASLFAYGYGGYGVVYVPGGRSFRKLEVHALDPNNPDGYIEVGRLIAGPIWTPQFNFSFGHSVTPVDSTSNVRTEAGDLRGEVSPKWRRIEFSLQYMEVNDRAALMNVLRMRGKSKPVFISLFPEDKNVLLEQSYQLWGKFEDNVPVSQAQFDIYAASSMAVEEM